MALSDFNLDAASVASLKPAQDIFPEIVSGRIAHIDADFIAYQVAAETKQELDPDDPTERRTYEQMTEQADEAAQYIRKMAGAEQAVLHITKSIHKGYRVDIAKLKPYQGNRANRIKPDNLEGIKEFLGRGANSYELTGCISVQQEADDTMCQAMFADPQAVLCSADKDLLMVPGKRLNHKTYCIEDQLDHFGFIKIDTETSSKKIVGRGTKFFWAQCLTGDNADNISGLPECPGEIAGTKSGKPKKCGPVLAYDLIKDATDDAECFKIVKECFVRLSKDHGYQFKHWKTGENITATQALLSEMQLLWMRRNPTPNDVLHWLKETL